MDPRRGDRRSPLLSPRFEYGDSRTATAPHEATCSFGVEIHPYYDVPTLMHEITLAEELGYDQVWIGDSQLIWREMYVLLGAAAQATSGILLGSGVTNPMTRVSAVTASAAATLQELSGGRLTLGIGNGFTSVNTMGRRPATLARLEQTVDEIRALCGGGACRWSPET